MVLTLTEPNKAHREGKIITKKNLVANRIELLTNSKIFIIYRAHFYMRTTVPNH
jgi:hypothetical protein